MVQAPHCELVSESAQGKQQQHRARGRHGPVIVGARHGRFSAVPSRKGFQLSFPFLPLQPEVAGEHNSADRLSRCVPHSGLASARHSEAKDWSPRNPTDRKERRRLKKKKHSRPLTATKYHPAASGAACSKAGIIVSPA